jgi:glyoxylase-like metal-dependent hydrolase (beta-lactamase superfamily II)
MIMKVPTIDRNTLQDILTNGEPVTVLDIRHSDEFEEWAIPDSAHIDAYDALKAKDPHALDDLKLASDRPVVTVCGGGVVSKEAARQLLEKGYQALSLDGGMTDWSLAWNSAEVPTAQEQTTIIQVRRTGKGCLSYLVGSGGKAAVFDAALEPEIYLDLARQQGWQISHVFDTHIHADHLSRSRLLTEAANAQLYLPAQERVSFPFTAVHDNDLITVGAAQIKALYTPGHTLESTSYLINDEALITGDTLFLAAVGRPDLKADPEQSRRRAHLLYSSLQRLLALPGGTLVLPGHTSRPVAFDGQALVAPLAEVRRETAVLSLTEDDFVETLLERIPATPPNHLRIVKLNEAGDMPAGSITGLEAGANRCAIG